MQEIPDHVRAEPSLIFRGDLDVTTALEALVSARDRGGDLGQAAGDLLQRHPVWMGSDGRYRPAGPGQVDERADQPRKLKEGEERDTAEGRLCCDTHGRNCEPPSELCCHDCAEAAHDTFPIRHAGGSTCVLGGP